MAGGQFEVVLIFANSRTAGAAITVALALFCSFQSPFSATAADAAPPQPSPPATGQSPAPPQPAPPATGQSPAPQHLDINEYRVEGVHLLSEIDVDNAVYPFLGPNRTTDDVEKARAALEKVYYAKGYQTVAVEIPPQQVKDGIVILKVTEGKVGRLRVKGSRYYSLDEIKEEAPSLAEGTVPNFNDVTQDIVGLNQLPDRKVTPTLRAGVTPGTVDVDLNVQDTLPFHGSLEINNRNSQGTEPLRLNAMLRYDNLWQLGHSFTVSYQVAPQSPSEAQVYSASYLARIPDLSWLSLLVYGLNNNSNVSTVGDTNVAGRGHIVGTRAVITLPSEQNFFHTLSVGIDYKDFDQNITLGGSALATPVTYYPFNATYSASWQGDRSLTQLDAGFTIDVRGLGSNPAAFDAQRFDAKSNFIYFRGDLSRTQDLPKDVQLFGKVQGQVSDEPLVSSEEFSGGGLESVRGYLESEVLGDNGLIGSVELRSPSLTPWLFSKPADAAINEWRFYLFAEGGELSINDPLPQQQSQFDLWSAGVGTRIKLLNHLNGSVDMAVPMVTQVATRSGNPRVTFRVWSEF